MTFDEISVGDPHNLIQFPEFGKEARYAVIDFLGAGRDHGMRIGLDIPVCQSSSYEENIPDGIWKSAATSTGHFLLAKTPLR